MTLLFTEGFNDLLPSKWDVVNIGLIESGRHGLGWRVPAGTTHSAALRGVFFVDSTEVIVGIAMKRDVLGTQGNPNKGLRFGTGGNIRHTIGPATDTGEFHIREGFHTGTIIASGGFLPVNVWVYVELKIVLGTSGTLEVRIDGTTVIDEADIDLGADPYNRFEIGAMSSSTQGSMTFDDIYLLDTLGTENNDFLGDVEIRSILPSGAGNRTQMINADETQVDNFSYVNTPGDEEGFVEGGAGVGDLYEMDNIDAGAIHGVIQYHKSKMSDTGVQKARHLTRYDNVDYEGPDANLGFSYNAFRRIWEKAPDDTEWTPAKLNATQMGVEGRG